VIGPGRFAGRAALVTGASRGIGAAIAERLAAEGADVVITARTLDADTRVAGKASRAAGTLTDVLDRLLTYGARARAVAADLADPEDRRRIVPEAASAIGRPIDILVNNAAAIVTRRPSEISARHGRLMFEVNVLAPMDLSQAVIPDMRERGAGWILNISSAGARPAPGPPFAASQLMSVVDVYGTTKAALNRLTNAFAAELDGTGIRVNTLEPRGAVATEEALARGMDGVSTDWIEPVEAMAEAAAVLCDCPPERTGLAKISLDLIAELGLDIRTLDAKAVLSTTADISPESDIRGSRL
jgi:NAD(P)-dependent dehydrogenase (short-subunit alcohol dehydrogenase family)